MQNCYENGSSNMIRARRNSVYLHKRVASAKMPPGDAQKSVVTAISSSLSCFCAGFLVQNNMPICDRRYRWEMILSDSIYIYNIIEKKNEKKNERRYNYGRD